MKPLRDNVLVKSVKGSQTTESGLYIPESAMKPSNKVKVVEVGNGTAGRPMRWKKGDIGYRVKDWSMLEVEIDGELHFLMGQDALIAKQ